MADKMLAITVPAYSPPAGYQISEMPRPALKEPTDLLIRVHAASINPIDVKSADGHLKFAVKDQFPYVIGFDVAGTVVEVGAGVRNFSVGEEVYSRLPQDSRGSWSEYVLVPQYFVALRPQSISFAEAASLPLAGMTALQALRKYKGGLEGKTVFVPAGLSGTGIFAIQLAKHVFGAAKVITTVSTSKVALVPQLLGEGTVALIIDYTMTDPRRAIPAGSVDFIFDGTGSATQLLSLLKPNTGMVISVATLPSGDQLQSSGLMRRPEQPKVPLLVQLGLNALDAISRLRARRWGVRYEYMFLEPNSQDLDTLREYVDEGKLKLIVGKEVEFKDIEQVREACQTVYSGKGGVGKMVIEVIKDNP